MTITIDISAAIIGRFDRLMDFLEGKQQAQIDAAAASMNALTVRLKTSQETLSGSVNSNK